MKTKVMFHQIWNFRTYVTIIGRVFSVEFLPEVHRNAEKIQVVMLWECEHELISKRRNQRSKVSLQAIDRERNAFCHNRFSFHLTLISIDFLYTLYRQKWTISCRIAIDFSCQCSFDRCHIIGLSDWMSAYFTNEKKKTPNRKHHNNGHWATIMIEYNTNESVTIIRAIIWYS